MYVVAPMIRTFCSLSTVYILCRNGWGCCLESGRGKERPLANHGIHQPTSQLPSHTNTQQLLRKFQPQDAIVDNNGTQTTPFKRHPRQQRHHWRLPWCSS
ncbi:hypothetical protein B0I37DRAFT_366784 [Chaetomium sp. MPI-CAGE-AT-0009]|nr:hypothetical protein B0I37DRAFT_366784 [Chaetomium sp. MPI-CAGE-AT-0009]